MDESRVKAMARHWHYAALSGLLLMVAGCGRGPVIDLKGQPVTEHRLRGLVGQNVELRGTASLDKIGLCLRARDSYLVLRPDPRTQFKDGTPLVVRGKLVYKEWVLGWRTFGLEQAVVEARQ